MKDIKKIMFATDFSDISKNAMDMANLLAKKLGCSLEVVHVYDPAVFEMPAPYSIMAGVGQWLDEHFAGMREQGRKALEELLPDLEVPCHGHFIEGKPGRCIVDFAAEHDIDLIILGTHGHQGLDRLVLGSVAEYVTRHAACAVLTVKCGSRE